MHRLLVFLILLSIVPVEYSFALDKRKFCLSKKKDRDKDFITDCYEVKKTKTNPKKKDTNRDGILDGNEDRDGNGIQNEDEDDQKRFAKKAYGNLDYDNDCLQNEDEDDWGMDPRNPDSDGDGIVDGLEDSDGDGILNKDEDDRDGEGDTKEDSACLNSNSPSPTPPPSDGGNVFDTSGNVTASGKVRLNIPSYLSSNIVSGLLTHNSYSCSGCHVERGGYTYDRIALGLTKAPMNTFGVTDQEIADLTAYLNRGLQ